VTLLEYRVDDWVGRRDGRSVYPALAVNIGSPQGVTKIYL